IPYSACPPLRENQYGGRESGHFLAQCGYVRGREGSGPGVGTTPVKRRCSNEVKMHLHFERTVSAKSDCPILSLTWMGKVPDELPEDEGWKLNRTNYYQEGWLATGNVRGIVGVTFTTSHCKKSVEFPLRTNYNLRGHRSEVSNLELLIISSSRGEAEPGKFYRPRVY
ncbi:unnamed protein product, partial [Acanthoscelides obtectus]